MADPFITGHREVIAAGYSTGRPFSLSHPLRWSSAMPKTKTPAPLGHSAFTRKSQAERHPTPDALVLTEEQRDSVSEEEPG
jgi:hypothetical protein